MGSPDPHGDEKIVSLWPTLHDGQLTQAITDLTARSVTFLFDVNHVRKLHNLPKETLFQISLRGVESVNVWADGYLGRDRITLTWSEFKFAGVSGCAEGGEIYWQNFAERSSHGST